MLAFFKVRVHAHFLILCRVIVSIGVTSLSKGEKLTDKLEERLVRAIILCFAHPVFESHTVRVNGTYPIEVSLENVVSTKGP